MWRGWLVLMIVVLVANGIAPLMQPCTCSQPDASPSCCAGTALMHAGCGGHMQDLKATALIAESNVVAATRPLTRLEVAVGCSEGRDCGASFADPSPGVHEPTVILRT